MPTKRKAAKPPARARRRVRHRRSTFAVWKCRICAYVVVLFKEPKTWRSVALLVAGLGVKISPENWEGIMSTGVIVAGLLGSVLHDRKPPRRR